ncbi:HNH endonuclease [bacterium]|nr:HNH endonuclease [bacterium]MBU1875023.1 HNH endonuclease [bacterium]
MTAGELSITNRSVLVLNQTYEPLHICDVRRAIVLLIEQKASMVEVVDHLVLCSASNEFPVPTIIRINRYIRVHNWFAVLNKANIFRRDNHTCQYCGATNIPLTIDHIIPKVLGGKETWENLVTACIRCNNKKGDRLLESAGMELKSTPKRPHKVHTLQRFRGAPLEEWRPYLYLD